MPYPIFSPVSSLPAGSFRCLSLRLPLLSHPPIRPLDPEGRNEEEGGDDQAPGGRKADLHQEDAERCGTENAPEKGDAAAAPRPVGKPVALNVHRKEDEEEPRAAGDRDRGEVQEAGGEEGERRGDEEPFDGPVPDPPLQVFREFPLLREGVTHPRRAVQGGVDRRRRREEGGDSDEQEPDGTQDRPRRRREGIVLRRGDLGRGERADGDRRDRDVEDHDQDHRDAVGPRQGSLRIPRVLRRVCDQFEALVSDEDDHPAGDQTERRRPCRGCEPGGVDRSKPGQDEEGEDRQFEGDDPLLGLADDVCAQSVYPGKEEDDGDDQRVLSGRAPRCGEVRRPVTPEGVGVERDHHDITLPEQDVQSAREETSSEGFVQEPGGSARTRERHRETGVRV